jgi:trimeric autotransporter adhesin
MQQTLLCLSCFLLVLFSANGQKVGIGIVNPSHDLHVRHSTGAGILNISQGLKVQNIGSSNSSWTLYTVNNGGELWFYAGTTNVGRFAVTGAYSVVSDVRAKNNIQAFDAVLNKVMMLEPKKYRYIHQNQADHLSLGFLAQSVMEVFPELVNQSPGDDESLTYAIDYSGFSVVAIKAIQEQQKQIADQSILIETMSDELARLKQYLGL